LLAYAHISLFPPAFPGASNFSMGDAQFSQARDVHHWHVDTMTVHVHQHRPPSPQEHERQHPVSTILLHIRDNSVKCDVRPRPYSRSS
jgi:hypothetical protein